jgi:hypothetical protein
MDNVRREQQTTVKSGGLFSAPKVEKEVVESRQSGTSAIKQGVDNLAAGVRSAASSLTGGGPAGGVAESTTVKKTTTSSGTSL